MVCVRQFDGTGDPNTAPKLAEYEYDALGRRVQTTDYVDAVTGNWLTTPRKTRHIYAGPETIEEYDVTGQTSGQGTLLRQFLWGDAGRFPEPLAMVTHGGESGGQGGPGVPADQSVFHYLHDGLGSVVGLTDASGEIVERYTYDPYGRPFVERWDATANNGAGGWVTNGVAGATIPAGGLCYSALGNPFTWTGQRYDAGTGLYGFPCRMYSPSLGRWLQRDPIGYAGGPNLYEYVLDSPMGLVDPLGLDGCGAPTGPGTQPGTKDKLKQNPNVNVLEGYRNGKPITIIHIYSSKRHLTTIICPSPEGQNPWSEGTPADGAYESCLQAALNVAQAEDFNTAMREASHGAYVAGMTMIVVGGVLVPGPEDLVFGAAEVLVEAAEVTGVLAKAARILKSGEKAEQEVVDAAKAEKAAEKAESELHHLATNKNRISAAAGGPWTPRFEEMFKKAGMNLGDGLNKIRVAGHYGPHPEAYHDAVFRRLDGATKGLEGKAYGQAFRTELDAIGRDATTAGSDLNKLLTGG